VFCFFCIYSFVKKKIIFNNVAVFVIITHIERHDVTAVESVLEEQRSPAGEAERRVRTHRQRDRQRHTDRQTDRQTQTDHAACVTMGRML